MSANSKAILGYCCFVKKGKFMGDEVKNPFEFQKATEEQSVKIQENMGLCKDLHAFFLTLPKSRETSLAITKLEEAAMWANKAIVFN